METERPNNGILLTQAQLASIRAQYNSSDKLQHRVTMTSIKCILEEHDEGKRYDSPVVVDFLRYVHCHIVAPEDGVRLKFPEDLYAKALEKAERGLTLEVSRRQIGYLAGLYDNSKPEDRPFHKIALSGIIANLRGDCPLCIRDFLAFLKENIKMIDRRPSVPPDLLSAALEAATSDNVTRISDHNAGQLIES